MTRLLHIAGRVVGMVLARLTGRPSVEAVSGCDPSPDRVLDDHFQASLDLIEQGWRPWFGVGVEQPWQYELIELRRVDTPVTVARHREIAPEMNGAGLYWRPWRGATIDAETIRPIGQAKLGPRD